MTARLQIRVGQCSEAGHKPLNQDFHGAVLPPPPLLDSKGVVLALADGISSSAVSQVASAAAVRGFLDDYYCSSEAWSVRRAGQCVLRATNSWLHAQGQRGDARFEPDRGYVCTFSALVFKQTRVHLLHVGDTRVYRLHPQALEQLSDDHRVRVSSVETYLGRALGAGPTVEIDYRHWEAEPGEVYLLATDGVYEYLDAAAVQAELAAHGDDLDGAAAALVALALARGSRDNLTLQIARVESLPPPDLAALPGRREGLRLAAPLAPRSRFEGYEVLRELHASARSHVYLARDEASGQCVALKLPAADLREQPEQLDRFALEEWIARRVDSAHVVRALPAERPREHLFVALEYLEGQTLAQWMRDHPRPGLAAVRALIEQVAAGLQALHRKEMLHQDLRPENFMIDASGTLKIIDLGSTHVAGLHEGAHEAPGPQALAGTLQYTAPEYFVGGVGSERSELFALAVLAYQMLCGQLPYGLQVTRLRGPADLRTLRYVPLREHRPDLPAWLDAVLRRALQPQPARRQEALSEFVHDLRQPAARYRAERGAPPLIERDPVRFWQGLCLLLALAVLGLAARLLAS